MHRICVFLLYIGELPNYWSLFLHSCERNATVEWVVLTDARIRSDLPKNVRIVHTTIESFTQVVRSRLGLNARIKHPYKLCDFRPALADLLPDLVEGVDFWGHCDADVIFGDLRKYLTPEILSQYDKVQMRGAFSLYRNSEVGNLLYKMPCEGIDYRECFECDKYFNFDEWEGLFKVAIANDVPTYLSQEMAEIKVGRKDVVLSNGKNYCRQLFVWESGRVLRYAWADGRMIQDEFIYIHLQKRAFTEISVDPGGDFCVLPGRFVRLPDAAGLEKLAESNCRSRLYELAYFCGRPIKRWRSRGMFDRSLYKLPKPDYESSRARLPRGSNV